MIEKVTFEETTYLDPPMRFEAGTPHIVGAVGLHAAVNWVERLTSTRSTRTNARSSPKRAKRCTRFRGVTLYGPEDSAGIVSFNVDGVHPHDTATILDDAGVAVRAGHHCAQPLMALLGVEATARASFAAHSDSSDIEALVRGIEQVKRMFAMNEERKIETRGSRRRSPRPPRARVTPEFERKRDYLAGFLAGRPAGRAEGRCRGRSSGVGRRCAEVDLRP